MSERQRGFIPCQEFVPKSFREEMPEGQRGMAVKLGTWNLAVKLEPWNYNLPGQKN